MSLAARTSAAAGVDDGDKDNDTLMSSVCNILSGMVWYTRV